MMRVLMATTVRSSDSCDPGDDAGGDNDDSAAVMILMMTMAVLMNTAHIDDGGHDVDVGSDGFGSKHCRSMRMAIVK